MNFLSIGLLIAIIGTFGIGLGDFFAGISSRYIGEKKTLLFIFFSQSLCALLYWLLFKHVVMLNVFAVITILIAGVFQGIGLVLFYKAMSIEKIALVSPIFATYSVLTILFGVLILHDYLTTIKIISIVLVFIGTILASSDFSFRNQKLHFSKGIMITLLGTLSFAIAFLLMTIVFKFSEYYFANFLYSFSTFLTAIFLNRKYLPTSKAVNKKIFLPLFVGFLYASSNIIWAIALIKIPSSVFGAVGATFPAITALAGFIFLKERLAKTQLFGVTVILLGLILLSI